MSKSLILETVAPAGRIDSTRAMALGGIGLISIGVHTGTTQLDARECPGEKNPRVRRNSLGENKTRENEEVV